MAVVDEASIRITPDTSGFAAELRSELEAEIAAATAGLDDTIHIKIDVDSDAARGKLADSLNEFQNDGARAFQGLKSEQQDLFDSIAQNTEKTRDKTVIEVTKTRDRVNQRLEPFWRKLKLKQTVVKTDFDKIKKSAEDAGKAAVKAFGEGGSGEALIRSEQALAKARADAEKAAASLAKAEADLVKARAASEVAASRVAAAEERLAAAEERHERTGRALIEAEQELTRLRAQQYPDLERIADAEEKLGTAREKHSRTTAQYYEAEGRLTQARQAGVNAANATADADQRINVSRDKVVESTTRVEEAERRVVRAHEESSRAAERHGNVLTRLGGRMRESGERGGFLGGVMNKLGGAFDFAGKIGDGFQDVLGKVAGKFDGLASSIPGVVQQVLQLGAKFTVFLAIAGLVSYAVGAIGAALAGIPALAVGAIASFAAIALGMDGIKKAYNTGLKPALDQLKKQVSDVFEKTLTPAFKKLGDELIPKITNNMKGLAQEFANTGVAIIDMVTQGNNIQKIQQIIDNTADSVKNQLKPALVGIVQEFINIGAQKPIMDAMVGIFSDLINNTQQWLAKMQQIGLLTPAVEALRSVLDTVERALFQILTAAIKFFTEATPGFEAMITSVGNLASSLLNDLGGAFNTAMQAASDFIDNIPPESLDAFKDSVKKLADAFLDFANSPAPGLIVDAITLIIDTFREFVNFVTVISEAFKKVQDAIDGLREALGPLGGVLDVVGRAFQGIVNPIGNAIGIIGGWGGATDEATADAERFGTDAPAAVTRGAQESAAAAARGSQEIRDTWKENVARVAPDTTSSFAAAAENVRGQGGVAAQRAGAAGVDTREAWQQGIVPIAADTNSSMAAAAENIRGQGQSAAATAEIMGRNVHRGVTTPIGEVPPDVQQALNGLPPAVQGPMTEAVTVAQGGADSVRTTVQTGFANAATEAQTQMNRIPLDVGIAMQAAGTAAEGGAQRVVAAIRDMVTQCQQAFTDLTTAATQASTQVQTAMTQMQTGVQTALAAIDTNFTTTFQNLKTTVETSMQQIKTTIDTIMQQAQQTIQQSLQQIQQNWQQTWQQIVQNTQQSWQQINAAITQGGQQAVAKCRQIAQQILQVFQQLAPQLEAAGRTMMQRLAAGITAGGAAAVAAARNVAAQIKAQFPSSPAKEGPLSGQGDPLISGGKIMTRLAKGISDKTRVFLDTLQPLLRVSAKVLSMAGLAAPSTGWSITQSTASSGEPQPHLIKSFTREESGYLTDKLFPRRTQQWNAGNGGILAEDGSYVNPNFYDNAIPKGASAQEIRSALEGLSIRIDDRGNGLAKLVNSQQRTLARR